MRIIPLDPGHVDLDGLDAPSGGALLGYDSDSDKAQAVILLEALTIYAERNERYKDNWRRMGWRGALIRLRERVERAWDYLWDAEVSRAPEGQAPVDAPAVDDVIDLINFAAFLVRGIRGETTRDGSWW
jgi:hypothetical protein